MWLESRHVSMFFVDSVYLFLCVSLLVIMESVL